MQLPYHYLPCPVLTTGLRSAGHNYYCCKKLSHPATDCEAGIVYASRFDNVVAPYIARAPTHVENCAYHRNTSVYNAELEKGWRMPKFFDRKPGVCHESTARVENELRHKQGSTCAGRKKPEPLVTSCTTAVERRLRWRRRGTSSRRGT